MEGGENRMKVNNHVLAIIQVFETFIDIDTNVLLQEIKKSDEKMNNDINHSFFEDYKCPNTPLLNELKNRIKDKTQEIMGVNLEYAKSWIHKTSPKASTGLHNHRGNFCSFVYYPNFIERQGGLRFIIFWNGKIIERIITPEKKMLLIFPSEVFHYTGQNDTKEERISISGNFDMQQKEQKKE